MDPSETGNAFKRKMKPVKYLHTRVYHRKEYIISENYSPRNKTRQTLNKSKRKEIEQKLFKKKKKRKSRADTLRRLTQETDCSSIYMTDKTALIMYQR